MKFTFSWLTSHLETSHSLEDIYEALGRLGLEGDSLLSPCSTLAGFVVGEILSVTPHPQADRLSVCEVKVGDSSSPKQVVCGAQNVRVGLKTAFAPIGAVIPQTRQPLKKGTIRGVESFGMLCSVTELCLTEYAEQGLVPEGVFLSLNHKEQGGILELPATVYAGQSLLCALGMKDAVMELSITPNRGDCFGVRGIARDLAAAGMGRLIPLYEVYERILASYPTSFASRPSQASWVSPFQVDLASPHCLAYQALHFKNIHNGPSPFWLQNRLRAAGLTPSHLVVDVTNYLCYDLGRPLHAFDAKTLQGQRLTVAETEEKTVFQALTEKTYSVPQGTLVVKDAAGPVALAGVMGHHRTACSPETTEILLECALFSPTAVARTGQSLSLLSDARTRFERGVDPHSQRDGLEIASLLLTHYGNAHPSLPIEGKCREGFAPFSIPSPTRVALTAAHILQILGPTLGGTPETTLHEVEPLLLKLGATLEWGVLDAHSDREDASTPCLWVTAPSWRLDLLLPIDWIEEIARLKGYDHLPAQSLPLCPPASSSPSQQRSGLQKNIRHLLASRGLQELVTWSFVSQSQATRFGGGHPSLILQNPISQELSTLRPTPFPAHLEAARRNEHRGIDSVAFFEVGPTFSPTGEQWAVFGLRKGHTSRRHWSGPVRKVDFYDAKADLTALLGACGIRSFQLKASGPDFYHPGRKASFWQGSRLLGTCGELHPQILKETDLKGPIVSFDLPLSTLWEMGMTGPWTPKEPPLLSPYPQVKRDFAFIVPKEVTADRLISLITKLDKILIQEVIVFDHYEGSGIPEGKKSLGIEVTLSSLTHTLTESEIQDISQKVIQTLSQSTQAILRQSL